MFTPHKLINYRTARGGRGGEKEEEEGEGEGEGKEEGEEGKEGRGEVSSSLEGTFDYTDMELPLSATSSVDRQQDDFFFSPPPPLSIPPPPPLSEEEEEEEEEEREPREVIDHQQAVVGEKEDRSATLSDLEEAFRVMEDDSDEDEVFGEEEEGKGLDEEYVLETANLEMVNLETANLEMVNLETVVLRRHNKEARKACNNHREQFLKLTHHQAGDHKEEEGEEGEGERQTSEGSKRPPLTPLGPVKDLMEKQWMAASADNIMTAGLAEVNSPSRMSMPPDSLPDIRFTRSWRETHGRSDSSSSPFAFLAVRRSRRVRARNKGGGRRGGEEYV